MEQQTEKQKGMARVKKQLSENEFIAFDLGADFLAEIRARVEFDEQFWKDPKLEEWREAVGKVVDATHNIYLKTKEAK